jgi:hypothetical protein
MEDPKQLKLLEVCVGSIAKSKYFGYMHVKAKKKKTDIFRMKTEHRRLEKDSGGGDLHDVLNNKAAIDSNKHNNTQIKKTRMALQLNSFKDKL